MDIWVFDKVTLEPLGILQTPTAWSYTEKFRGAGDVQIWMPLTEINTQLCKIGNIVWLKDDDIAMEIELVQTSSSSSGATITVQGYTSEGILRKRIVWGMYSKFGKPVALIEGLVNDQIVSPTDEKRVYPNLVISPYTEEPDDTKSVQYQNTGGILLDEVSALAELYEYGFKIKLDPVLRKYTFSLYKGTDRSIDNGKISPVVLSTDFENLLSSEYLNDHLSYKSTALVQGAGEGTERTSVTVGEEASGIDRRELYVDARDLQNIDENGFEMPTEDYQALLIDRGNTRLSENKAAENFSTTVNTLGNIQYKRDYFLGDTVTVQDKRLGLQLRALITEVEHTYDSSGRNINITFGYGQPTLIDKLQRRL